MATRLRTRLEPAQVVDVLSVIVASSPTANWVAWQDAFAGTEVVDDSSYLLAGALVTRLLSEHGGMSKFRQLHQSVPRFSPPEYFASAFQRVYGVDIDTVWSALFAGVKIPTCLPIWACAAGELSEAELSKLVKRLSQRWFLLRDAHAKHGMVLMQPRWAMSFMRGPMTRMEIRAALARGGG